MKNWIKVTSIFLMCVMVSACSYFGKKQVDTGLKSSPVQRIETMLVIFDATESLGEQAFGQKKLDVSKNILTLLNHELKELELTSGLRTVDNKTQLVFGLSRHNPKKFQRAVNAVTSARGNISLDAALNTSKYDLRKASGNVAIVVISDGMSCDNSALKTAEILASEMGSRLCLYTIRVGNHPKGVTYMEQLARKSSCGFSVSASKLNSRLAMKTFVQSLFFAGPKDSLVEEVDIQEADADGDGIPNTQDQCDRTPEGAVVDANGCWNIKKILFDWDKADVKTQYQTKLKQATEVFKSNPYLRVELQGHADNTGEFDYNKSLSIKRANNVQKILIKNGTSANQLSTKGLGSTQPSVPNDSEENRALNRRVETIIK